MQENVVLHRSYVSALLFLGVYTNTISNGANATTTTAMAGTTSVVQQQSFSNEPSARVTQTFYEDSSCMEAWGSSSRTYLYTTSIDHPAVNNLCFEVTSGSVAAYYAEYGAASILVEFTCGASSVFVTQQRCSEAKCVNCMPMGDATLPLYFWESSEYPVSTHNGFRSGSTACMELGTGYGDGVYRSTKFEVSSSSGGGLGELLSACATPGSLPTVKDPTCNYSLTGEIAFNLCGEPASCEEDRGPSAVACESQFTSTVRLALANRMFFSCYSRCLYSIDGNSSFAWNGYLGCWIRSSSCSNFTSNIGSLESAYVQQQSQTLNGCVPSYEYGRTMSVEPCSSSCGEGSRTRVKTCKPDYACPRLDPSTGLDFCVAECSADESCENYDGCDFSITCPFGQGSGSEETSFPCFLQVAVILSSSGIVVFCSIFCWIRHCKHKYERTYNKNMAGQELIEGVETNFKIYVPSDLHPELDIEMDPDDSHQLHVDHDKRIHIVWALDDTQVRKASASQAVLPGGYLPGDVVFSKINFNRGGRLTGEKLRPGDAGSVMGASPDGHRLNISFATMKDVNLAVTQIDGTPKVNIHEDAIEEEEVSTAPSIDKTIPEKLETPPTEARDLAILSHDSQGNVVVRPMRQHAWFDPSKLFVAEGSRMEYYTDTYKRWFPAVVNVEESGANNVESISLGVMYTACMGHGRKRQDAMRYLRRPFDTDDLVEVFLPRPDDGAVGPRQSRLSSSSLTSSTSRFSDYSSASGKLSHEELEGSKWYAGHIHGPQQKSSTLVGYRVCLEATDEILELVPSWRLRQRHPRGQSVYVYKGIDDGWLPGEVDASSSGDGLGAKILPLNALRELASDGSSSHFAALDFGYEEPKVKPVEEKTSRPQTAVQRQQNQKMNLIKQMLSPRNFTKHRGHRSSIAERDVAPWVMVPVILDGSDDCQEYPSYLVRPRYKVSV